MSKFGGGGGDSGQGAAQAEAERVRLEEEQRQARVQEGIDRINAVFLGGKVPTGRVAPGTAFDPAKSFFDREGTAFDPKAGGFEETLDPLTPAQLQRNAEAAQVPEFIFPVADSERTRSRRFVADPSGTPQQQFDKRIADTKLGGLFTGFDESEGFTEPFFDRRRQAELDFNLPQLEEQFQDRRKGLTFALANSGLLNSSVANEQVAELAGERDVNDALIRSRAETGVGDLRRNIEDSRASLIRNVQASGDADSAASLAGAQARNFGANTPNFSPLGELFKPIVVGASSFLTGRNDRAFNNSARGGGFNSGSGRSVG